jgi:hypothetical protein
MFFSNSTQRWELDSLMTQEYTHVPASRDVWGSVDRYKLAYATDRSSAQYTWTDSTYLALL